MISGNRGPGVSIGGAGAFGATVQGNLIGTAADGVTPLGNGGDGVGIFSSATGRTIGGKGAGEGNVIAHNGGDGVSIVGDADAVLGNVIFSNGGLGIDLEDDGPTVNDVGDTDTGSNNLLNFPVLTSATVMTTSSTDIIGGITSTPSLPIE